MSLEKIKISIYTFSLEGDKDGPLKGWKKFLFWLARIYCDADSTSWLFWLKIKSAGRRFLAFVTGQG